MIDIEKFLVSLRSNKDLDGKLKPICLADTVQEEIRIIQAAVENSRREWVGLTRQEAEDVVDDFITMGGDVENWVGYWQAIEAKLKDKNT